MAKKEAFDIQGKTPDELGDTLLDLKKQQFNLRFQLSQGQMANTAQLRVVRRNIARVHTALSPAGQAASKAAKAPKAKKVKAASADAPATKKPAAKKATKKSAA